MGRRSIVALCLGCNYPLAKLPEPRCPECGRSFDRNDIRTVNPTGRPIGAMRRSLVCPRLSWLHVVAGLICLWCLWEARLGWFGAPRWRLPWHWVHLRRGLVGAWALLATVKFLANRSVPAALRSRWRWHWLVLPAILLAYSGLRSWEVSRRITWALNGPALNRWAEQTLRDPPRLKYADRRIGAYSVGNIYHTGRHVGFGWDDPPGFLHVLLYAPDGDLSEVHRFAKDLRPLGDGWYGYELNWGPPSGAVLANWSREVLVERMAADPAVAARNPGLLIAMLEGGPGMYERDCADLVGGLYWDVSGTGDPHQPLGHKLIGVLRPDMRALIGWGKPAAPVLAAALQDPAPAIRMRAACCLGRMGEDATEAVPALCAMLGDPRADLRDTAAWALGEISGGDEAMAPRYAPAHRSDPATFEPAARALLPLLNDPDELVRYNAAVALRRIQPAPRLVAPALVRALPRAFGPPATQSASPSPLAFTNYTAYRSPMCLDCAAHYAAREILGLQGDCGGEAADAVPFLMAQLRCTAPRRDLGRYVAQALRRIGPPRERAAGRLSVAGPDELLIQLCGDDPQAAVEAGALLAEMGERSVPVLVRAITGPAPCERAGVVLGWMGRPAVPALIERLRAEGAWQRRDWACEILRDIGPGAADAVPGLLELLRSWPTSDAAAEALGRIGVASPEVLEALEKTRRDYPRFQIAREAERALNRLRRSTSRPVGG